MGTGQNASLTQSILSLSHRFFDPESLCITLGLFLIVFDVVDKMQTHLVLGTRLLFLGFCLQFGSMTPSLLIPKREDQTFRDRVGRDDYGDTWLGRLLDWNRLKCVVLLVAAVMPSRYLFEVYSYLK